VLHQIQNHALATEQRAGIVAYDGQHLVLMDAHAVKHLRMADDLEAGLRGRATVEARKDFQKARHCAQTADHHLLSRHNRGRGQQVGVDCEVGGGVAGGPVFNQCSFQQCFDVAILPIHNSSFARQRLRLIFLALKKVINHFLDAVIRVAGK
jgi:hypothetical protein